MLTRITSWTNKNEIRDFLYAVIFIGLTPIVPAINLYCSKKYYVRINLCHHKITRSTGKVLAIDESMVQFGA